MNSPAHAAVAALARSLDRAVAYGLWVLVFLAPLKWGLPVMEPDKNPLPLYWPEWLIGSWPQEIFCFAVFFLFFVQCLRIVAGGILPRVGPSLVLAGPLLFLAAAVIAGRFSAHPSLSLSWNLTYCAYVLLFLLFLWRADTYRSLLVALVACAGVVSLFAVFQRFSGFGETSRWASLYLAGHPQMATIQAKLESGRVFSTLVYPNSLGGYLVMVLPVVFFMWWGCRPAKIPLLSYIQRGQWAGSKDSRARAYFFKATCVMFLVGMLYLWISIVFPLSTRGLLWHLIFLLGALLAPLTGLVALVLSKSQGSLLVFLFLLLCAVIYVVRKRWRNRRLAMVAGGLGCAALFLFFGAYAAHIKWDTLLMRWTYWVAAWKMGVSRWWLGYGPGSFGVVYPQFKLDWGGETQLAHSHGMQIFAEMGVFGLAGWFLWWLGWIFLKPSSGGERPATARSLLWGATIGMTAFLLHGAMDFDFFVPGIVIQALLLCAILWQDRLQWHEAPLRLPKVARCVVAVLLGLILIVLPYRHFYRVALGQGYFGKGIALAARGQWRDAEVAFQEAVSLAPDTPAYRFYRGLVLEQQGNFNLALDSYRSASALAPTVAYYHYRIGMLAQNIDRSLAIKALREACKYYPGNLEYAIALRRLGAAEEWRNSLAPSPLTLSPKGGRGRKFFPSPPTKGERARVRG